MNRLIVFIFLATMYFGCSEVPVVIPSGTGPVTGTYTQNVLIEEYTGVRCQNCPAGAQTLEDLISIHGNRLVIVSIHGGFFAQPTNRENKLRLDNSFGQDLITIFNQPLGYPSGMINRKTFDGQSSRFLGSNSWAGYILSEKNKTPDIGIDLEIQLLMAQKKLNVACVLHGLADLSTQSLRLSMCIVENNIKDAQLTPVGVDTAYIHRHVLRTFLSSIQGDVVEPVLLNGQKTYSYSTTYPSEWDPLQLSVIAFIHKPGPGYDVVQVLEKKIFP